MPDEYVCPNGHPFPERVAIPCGQCDASVVCAPDARVLELRGLIAELRRFIPYEKAEHGPLPGWITDLAARVGDALELT